MDTQTEDNLLKHEFMTNYVSVDNEALNNITQNANENNTLAIAESITGGRLASLISSKSGASSFFIGGVVCYSSTIKEHVLGISNEILEPCNCVSIQVSKEMAKNVTTLMKTTYGIATTGYAEPPNKYEKYIENKGMIEIPHAYICLYNSNTKKYSYKLIMDFEKRTRIEMQDYVSKEAFDLYSKCDI